MVSAGNLRPWLQLAEKTPDSQIIDLRQRLLTLADIQAASGHFLPTASATKLVDFAGAAGELFIFCVVLGFQKFRISLLCCEWYI